MCNSQNNELFLLATKGLPVKNIILVKVGLFRTPIRGH